MLGKRRNSRSRFSAKFTPRLTEKNRPLLEELETRTLLSTTLLSSPVHAMAQPTLATNGGIDATISFNGLTNAPNVSPFTPAALRTVYAVNKIQFINGS